jgi:putative transcriptional regulator
MPVLPGCLLLLLLVAPTAGVAGARDDAYTGLAPAAGRLLVAQRSLRGPWFARSVVYLLQHDAHGTTGLILNRPAAKQVSEVLPEVYHHKLGSFPVYHGGPVSRQLMVLLFRGDYPDDYAVQVQGDVYASSDRRMLGRLLQEDKPQHQLRVFAGQAGWSPGQLQQELDEQSWYVMETTAEQVFELQDAGLWQRLIDRLDPIGIMVMRGAVY